MAALTDIAGIGPATAEKLQAAGVVDVPALASADFDVVAAIEGLSANADVAAWIEAAKQVVEVSGGGDRQPEMGQSQALLKVEGGSITVRGPRNGRRRAGFRFGHEPVTIAIAGLGEAGVKAIMSDPALTYWFKGEG